jgi:hypothetical protein
MVRDSAMKTVVRITGAAVRSWEDVPRDGRLVLLFEWASVANGTVFPDPVLGRWSKKKRRWYLAGKANAAAMDVRFGTWAPTPGPFLEVEEKRRVGDGGLAQTLLGMVEMMVLAEAGKAGTETMEEERDLARENYKALSKKERLLVDQLVEMTDFKKLVLE